MTNIHWPAFSKSIDAAAAQLKQHGKPEGLGAIAIMLDITFLPGNVEFTKNGLRTRKEIERGLLPSDIERTNDFIAFVVEQMRSYGNQAELIRMHGLDLKEIGHIDESGAFMDVRLPYDLERMHIEIDNDFGPGLNVVNFISKTFPVAIKNLLQEKSGVTLPDGFLPALDIQSRFVGCVPTRPRPDARGMKTMPGEFAARWIHAHLTP